MSPLPEDVMEAAREWFGKGDDPYDDIARAILAERKRCAEIARNCAGHVRLGGINAWHGAEHIAKVIEAGPCPASPQS